MKLRLIVAAAFAAFAACAAAQTEIKFGHVGEPGSLFAASAEEFAKRANAKLGGKAKVVVYGSSQLGGDKELLQKLKLGTVDIALPSTVMSSEADLFGVFEMPYLIVSRAHMKKAADTKQIQTQLLGALPAKGMRLLGVWENGFRHITNNVRPIVRPEDLKGIKLRVPGGVWRVKMFQAYGANPSPMPFAEVYSALQSGVMDAQENPFSQIFSAKFHEVQKFLSLTGHVYTPAFLIVSEDFWKKQPKDIQDTIARIARDTGDFARAEGERLDRELQSRLAPPMKSNEPDKEAFIKA
ncbi:MAG: TRAP transporter substrate-binding protein, partial [Panacagrimonas sp.]